VNTPESPSIPRPLRLEFRVRVWLAEVFRPNELQVTLFWAGVIGFAGALSSVGFRKLTTLVHWLLTHQDGGYVESASRMDSLHRALVPLVGGLLAGGTLFFGTQWSKRKNTTDYMEAIVLGEGIVSARSSLVKSLSAMFSIASGASIGREGPLVQLSAMLASGFGRLRKMPILKLRLLVACGAAAGIASAYNAPIGGALFVAEIVLESLAMETFGPLVFSSVVATLTMRNLLGEQPLYQIPSVHLQNNWEILPHVMLGLAAGLLAPWYLRSLRQSEWVFSKLKLPIYLRLALGGAVVGILSIWRPEVCGNGYSVVNRVLHGEFLWSALLIILLLKLAATAATFGSGAAGGVFTPTLFAGACIGSLVCQMIQPMWPGHTLQAEAFIVVGMGAFLAASTHAPIMAIIIIFELTLDYPIILPLMLACVVAHYTSLAFEKKSIYADSLQRKGQGAYQRKLSTLRVADLMKRDPVAIPDDADFRVITAKFVSNRFNYLYVTDPSGAFLGAIALHDIKSYLNEAELASVVVARDIVREDIPTIAAHDTLSEALDRFAQHDGERLPVLIGDESRKLIGSLSKTDLILALAERSKPAAQTAA
jgi:chloride channel protein, CIC family